MECTELHPTRIATVFEASRFSFAEPQRHHRIASRGKTGRASTYKRRRRCSCWTRTSMETPAQALVLYGKTTKERIIKPFNHLAGPRRTDFHYPSA